MSSVVNHCNTDDLIPHSSQGLGQCAFDINFDHFTQHAGNIHFFLEKLY